MGVPSLDPLMHLKSPTRNASRYVDMRGVVAKLTACLSAPAGLSATTFVFEIAVSPLSTIKVVSKVALYAGSSKLGNARRASVDSNCVTA